MDRVPHLHPKPPGIGLRLLGRALPGIREVSDQIEPYTRWWSDSNQTEAARSGPLLAVVGDSTAIGIGASGPDRGYVGLLRAALDRRDGLGGDDGDDGDGDRSWRVINLAQSGARAADGLDRQLPILADLAADRATAPTITISLIGSNDVVWSKDTTVLRERLRSIIEQLPRQSLVGLVAGGSPRARLANRAIKNAAVEHGHRIINPWAEPGPPPQSRLAGDRFHPNDLGYVLMSRPFARSLDAPEPAAD